jgi:hypothetical protein
MAVRNLRLYGGVSLLLVIVALIAVLARAEGLAIAAGALGLAIGAWVLLRRESGPPAS